MKSLFGVLVGLLICYIIFFDLKHGTLPTVVEEHGINKIERVNSNASGSINFFEEQVSAGDTVLTIVENKLDAQIPVSINEIVKDFMTLNDGISPQKIQIGKVYRFPDYSNQ